ncbi:MAG: hypothetical protein AAF471_09070, partial [Myxococcota bacterium]
GVPMGTPVFDGAHEDDIVNMLAEAGLDASGQVTLVDGRTGESWCGLGPHHELHCASCSPPYGSPISARLCSSLRS